MPRTIETGIEFTYLDVSFFQDRKIMRLQRRVDAYAPLAYIAVLCSIFKEGYYIRWDEDLALDIAKATSLDGEYISKVIEVCFEVGLLSKKMFDKHGILTSVGIQRQYQRVCERSKRKSQVDEYSLLGTQEKEFPEQPVPQPVSQSEEINSEDFAKNSEELPNNSEDFAKNSPYSKVKESKVKESKDSFSSLSSFSSDEKQQQELFFLHEMFFKNWENPEEELEKFIAFNNTGGRCWDKMSTVERDSAFKLWAQKPARPPRFPIEFLKAWKKIFLTIQMLGAPEDVLRDALSDKFRIEVNRKEKNFTLVCSRRLMEFIEDPGNIDAVIPAYRKLIKDFECVKIKYKCTSKNEEAI